MELGLEEGIDGDILGKEAQAHEECSGGASLLGDGLERKNAGDELR